MNNSMMAQAMAIKTMLSGKAPGAVAEMLMQTNPQFKKFVNDTKGMSVEQIADQYGIDKDTLHQLLS